MMKQQALDIQNRAKNAAIGKKKTLGSDLSSARGSEERHASVPTTARGQKRARNMEIEEVCANVSIFYTHSAPTATLKMTQTLADTGKTASCLTELPIRLLDYWRGLLLDYLSIYFFPNVYSVSLDPFKKTPFGG